MKDEIYSNMYGFWSYKDLDYARLYNYNRELIKIHEGKVLDDVLNGEYLENDVGVCYQIVSEEFFDFTIPPLDLAKKIISSQFQLVEGIGKLTADDLRKEGYYTLYDLKEHPRWAEKVSDVLNRIDNSDGSDLFELIYRWFPRNHPLSLLTARFHNMEEILYLDIETLGLNNQPVILIGLAEHSDRKLKVYQYLLSSKSREHAILKAMLNHFMNKKALVTYNGISFDIPYLQRRLDYYGIEANLKKCHYDLLPFSRQAWKNKLPNCKLGTIEKYILGLNRGIDIPGAMVPYFYETYIITGNVGPLTAIVEHNRQDLLSLSQIIVKLWKES